MAPLASALNNAVSPVVTQPLVCGRGLMGGVTRGIRKQPAFAAAKALALRLCFFSAGLVNWLCSLLSLGLRGRSGRCHDPGRGLVPCSGAAIGWSHAHGRCSHHQLGPEAGALRDQSCEYLLRRDSSGGRTALPAVGEGTLWDRRAEAAPRISPSPPSSSVRWKTASEGARLPGPCSHTLVGLRVCPA